MPAARRTRRSRSAWRVYADCLAGLIAGLGIERPFLSDCRSAERSPSTSADGTPPFPNALVLVSAYAGWAGSLPADVAEQRLRQALTLADATPEEFRSTLLPTMFTQGTAPDVLDAFGDSMLAFHPAGFRAMALASAEDLRDALAHVRAPTLLVYGDTDVRAPLDVARRLHAEIRDTRLVVLPGVGHVCNVEAPHEFDTVVRRFLRDFST